MDIESKIKHFGATFDGRLDRTILEDAIADAEFGEYALAVETLCDQLYEYGVTIRDDEFRQLHHLAIEVGADLGRVESLKRLCT